MHFGDYIHDIETRGDPQFQIRELNECRLQREQLIAKIEELKQAIERLKTSSKTEGSENQADFLSWDNGN
jgi:hypothetical protein